MDLSFSSTVPPDEDSFGPKQHSPERPQRIVEVVDDPLLQRDDRVVRDADVLRADFRAALRDVAEPDPERVLQEPRPVHAVERVHLERGHADEEARAAEALLLAVVAQDVAHVLAEKTLDALA